MHSVKTCGGIKSLLSLPRTEPHFLRCPTHSLFFIPAVLRWLHSFLQTLNKLYLALVWCLNLAVVNFFGCTYGKVLLEIHLVRAFPVAKLLTL
jgi:hypothetical protein